ncbi:hypothetical protein TEA_007439 [Camellia sinensis var. sinensis]|uniref:Uncharacterized protein n=1 Tax=Camellia sinensis var. sinensis TaxID=542762 RepID=A0A4S4D240_CAMSN|nr:hypothetical protein TEA_007439 [Camellia sinensis var. sinensis]
MGRSPCCEKAHTNKGAWTKEEDQRLINYIRSHGEGCWRSLPKSAGLLRCGKSCRLRWINYLRPDLKRGNFTEQEDELIIKLHSMLGNKWSLIAGRLPGRTDNEIKNYWNTHIKRKLIVRGLDPQTHRPLNATASTTTANSKFDFRNASHSYSTLTDIDLTMNQNTFKLIAMADDSSFDDGKCNSGTTEEAPPQLLQPPPLLAHHSDQNCQSINLDLSIGLVPFQSLTRSESANSNSAEIELKKEQEEVVPYQFVVAARPSETPAPQAVIKDLLMVAMRGRMERDEEDVMKTEPVTAWYGVAVDVVDGNLNIIEPSSDCWYLDLPHGGEVELTSKNKKEDISNAQAYGSNKEGVKMLTAVEAWLVFVPQSARPVKHTTWSHRL